MENAGQSKVDEYVERIKGGESKDSILDGLPKVFIEGIEERLRENELVQEASDQEIISDLRNKLGIPNDIDQNSESFPGLDSMTTEEFAVWFAEEMKNRNVLPKEDVYSVLTTRPEFRQLRVKSALGDPSELLSVYSENKDKIFNFKNDTESNMSSVEGSEYKPGTWDHFSINDEEKKDSKTHKGYLTIDSTQVLEKFSTDIRKGIVRRLIEKEYRGQVKFPVTGSRALFGYDNIVLHGIDSEQVEEGLKIVQEYLSENEIIFGDPKRGVDSKNEKGEKKSYTERIAELVEKYIKDPTINLQEEISKLSL